MANDSDNSRERRAARAGRPGAATAAIAAGWCLAGYGALVLITILAALGNAGGTAALQAMAYDLMAAAGIAAAGIALIALGRAVALLAEIARGLAAGR